MQERWLFPGRRPGKPMTTRQLNRLFHEARRHDCLISTADVSTKIRHHIYEWQY
jgi:hypothetical protein